jgi:hypothetical protein
MGMLIAGHLYSRGVSNPSNINLAFADGDRTEQTKAEEIADAIREAEGGFRMKRKKMMVFLIGFFFVWNISRVYAQFSEAGVEKFRVAVDAPDFTLKEIGGGKISLKELRGKIIVLNFFATY